MNDKLIRKYIQGNATEDEVKTILSTTLESQKFKAELIERIKINALTSEEELNFNEAWSAFKDEKKSLGRKNTMRIVLRVAAVFIIGLFVGSFFFNSNENINYEDKIVLELSNGTKKIINTSNSSKIVNAEGKIVGEQIGSKIIFLDRGANAGEIKYNTLRVPLGKRFQIEFSDGSVAHLNSGTNIKFPVQFKIGEPRRVFLDGEAYFDITKDKVDSFVVSTSTLDTKVYGTIFNVSSYKSDAKNEIVLVEGKVGVYKNGLAPNDANMTYLKPNQMAFLNSTAPKIKISNVNPNDYTSWIKGELVFNNLPFVDIIRKLERHYNVKIENKYTTLNNIRFTGNFDTETINQVLKSFSNYREFNYKINNNKIIIDSKLTPKTLYEKK